MNVKLFREIQEAIRQEPERFDMSEWIEGHYVENGAGFCGTAACIAGFACLLDANKTETEKKQSFKARVLNLLGLKQPCEIGTPLRARKLLGIDYEQGERLFFVHNWPAQYRTAYAKATTKACEAKAACERIDHFIKTEGRE